MAGTGDMELTATSMGEESTRRYDAARWLRKMVGVVAAKDLPAEPSEEDFRQGLRSGMMLCKLLNKIKSGAVPKVVKAPSAVFTVPDEAAQSAYFENIRNFLVAVDEMGLPTFDVYELEEGGDFPRVVDCLLALKSYSDWKGENGSRKFSASSKSSPGGKTFSRRNSEPSMSTTISRTQSIGSDKSLDMMDQGGDASDVNEECDDSGPLYMIVCDLLEDREEEDIPLIVENILNKVTEEFESRVVEKTKKVSIVTAHMTRDSNGFSKMEPPRTPSEVIKPSNKEVNNEKKEEATQTTEKEENDSVEDDKATKQQEHSTREDDKAAKEQEHINREKELLAQQEKARKEEEDKAAKEQERINREKELLAQQEKARKEEEDNAAKEQERINREKELLAQQEKARKEEEDNAAKEQERINREKELLALQEKARMEEEKAAKEQERINREKELLAQQEKARKEEEEKAAKEQERINREKELLALQEKARMEEEKAAKEQERIKREKELLAQKEKARKREEKKRAAKEQARAAKEQVRAAKEQARIEREKELQALKEKARNEQEKKKIAKEQARIQREKEILAQKEKARLAKEQERLQREKELLELKEKLKKQEDDAREQERIRRENDLLYQEERARKQEEYKQRMDKYNGLNAKTENRQVLVGQQHEGLQELRGSLSTTKIDIQSMQKDCQEEADNLGKHVHQLCQAAAGYNKVLEENRKLYNQVQDLKGSIRVYCRVRPFLPGQENRPTSVDYMDNETVTIIIPSKSGREGRKASMFNKVFGPSATQEEVFSDTQPLIRSVLDGFNVCIFAYGQTGAGKTYTMTGPSDITPETMGVNYRALNDLFLISEERKNLMAYEISVNMLEIYNDEIRDLLVTDGTNKIVDIRSGKKGINVPDANLVPVTSTDELKNLMDLSEKNRAVSSTASSCRSHSFLTVHVFGKDLTAGTTTRGCMHLVDLAGSERLDDAADDALEEATHINKSLSALGDIMVALALKSKNVPYKSCKLTQFLQDALGGQAKILMFVHIHPDADEAGETLNTLKFTERYSTVEGGCGKSPEVRELKEQVAYLKAVLAKKESGDFQPQELSANSPRSGNQNGALEDESLDEPDDTASSNNKSSNSAPSKLNPKQPAKSTPAPASKKPAAGAAAGAKSAKQQTPVKKKGK